MVTNFKREGRNKQIIFIKGMVDQDRLSVLNVNILHQIVYIVCLQTIHV